MNIETIPTLGGSREGRCVFLDSQSSQNKPTTPLIHHISSTKIFFSKLRLCLLLLSESFSVLTWKPEAVDRR